MELFKAARQWAERPADERFWNVRELDQTVREYRSVAQVTKLPYGLLSAIEDGDEVKLLSRRTNTAARMTHWAFGQLCQRAGAPAAYLRDLPAKLAADCLNVGLAERTARGNDEAQLMFHRNGGLIARAITSDIYDRIWNADISPFLVELLDRGWITPPARPVVPDSRTRVATAEDVAAYGLTAGHPALSIRIGDLIAPAGVYASDHDMFAFMINPNRTIEDGSAPGMHRGIMVWNSEVGSASFGLQKFLFRHVCGNHIIWGASTVETVRIRHVGQASRRFGAEIRGFVEQLSETAASEDEAIIRRAKTVYLGKTKDEALAKVFGMRLVSKTAATSAYEIGLEHADEDGDPKTVWGYANALTRYSQGTDYADERAAVDRAAGKVLQIAF